MSIESHPTVNEKATDSISQVENYKDILVNAKACMSEGNYGAAAEMYGRALELMSKGNLDQLSLPFAPLYYAYGVCLLNFSIEQSSILGDALQAKDTASKVASDMDEETSQNELRDEGSNDANTKDVHMDGMDIDAISGAVENLAGAAVEKTMDLIDDLQVAWEVLDTSRIIYENALKESSGTDVPMISVKLANVYIALGDTSMESDSFEQAASDYKKALALRETYMDRMDRAIPEVLFKIGVAYEVAEKPTEAEPYIQQALNVLKARHNDLSKRLASSCLKAEECKQYQDEITDLQSLFPDLEAKLEELRKPSGLSLEEKMSVPVKAANIPVQDISNLVKRKPASSN